MTVERLYQIYKTTGCGEEALLSSINTDERHALNRIRKLEDVRKDIRQEYDDSTDIDNYISMLKYSYLDRNVKSSQEIVSVNGISKVVNNI